MPAAAEASSSMSAATDFIEKINVEYEALHKAFEYQFWGTKMALKGAEWSVPELTRTKAAMEAFLASKEKLAQTRALLASGDASLTEEERKTLEIPTKKIKKSVKSYYELKLLCAIFRY